MARARIISPAKNAMQSGRGRRRKWLLEYEPATPRAPEPLMGWTSAGDTLNQVRVWFDTLDEAVAFAGRKGLDYSVVEPQVRTAKHEKLRRQFPLRPRSRVTGAPGGPRSSVG